MTRDVRIGLFGFGCVGQGLHDIINKVPLGIRIDKVCVKDRTKFRNLSTDTLTYTPSDILDNPDIDLVVELIDDHVAAFDITARALRNGKPVVTANKRMLAGNLDALLRLQSEQPGPFLYEAACCASIPIIRTLEQYYEKGDINSLEGIVNGTTNYILTQMFRDGVSFNEALRLAQHNGFAESDPSMDIEAFDAKFKLCLLTTHALGVVVPVDQVFNYGIGTIGKEDIDFVRSQGYVIKLIARASQKDDWLSAFVLPQCITPDSPLYSVSNEFNGILVHTPYSDAQFFHGKGAGGHPTASAVLADITAAAARYHYGYGKFRGTEKPTFTNDVFVNIYCRYRDTDIPNELLFDSIDRRYNSATHNYVTGRISLTELLVSPAVRNSDVFIAALPNESQ